MRTIAKTFKRGTRAAAGAPLAVASGLAPLTEAQLDWVAAGTGSKGEIGDLDPVTRHHARDSGSDLDPQEVGSSVHTEKRKAA